VVVKEVEDNGAEPGVDTGDVSAIPAQRERQPNAELELAPVESEGQARSPSEPGGNPIDHVYLDSTAVQLLLDEKLASVKAGARNSAISHHSNDVGETVRRQSQIRIRRCVGSDRRAHLVRFRYAS
jgi:hypothetical protein